MISIIKHALKVFVFASFFILLGQIPLFGKTLGYQYLGSLRMIYEFTAQTIDDASWYKELRRQSWYQRAFSLPEPGQQTNHKSPNVEPHSDFITEEERQEVYSLVN